MDKSRMTFTFRPKKESPVVTRELRDRRPFEYKARSERKSFIRNADPRKKRDLHSEIMGLTWLMPAALAAITGITLGLGVLFLFKHADPESGASVTTVNSGQPGANAASSIQTFPGLDLVAYQVGVYKDHESAKKGAAEFEKFGIRPVLRNSDKVQLFVGLAVDKTQGQTIADALQQNAGALSEAKAPLYVKEFKIPQRKGAMTGIPAKEAANLANVLAQAVQIMKDGVPLAVEKTPKKEKVEVWSQRVQSLVRQAEIARKSLEKAGKKGELTRLDDMIQQLQEASASMTQGKGILEAQRSLVQSVVDYEELTVKLMPATAP
ncbi:hypothetical protein [Effusibacillus consociatus]|uniref:SPOR domain-containing protein n=1 Tax=Effusibacillus consociatus TaxID=1117041 RepID=A0ABV9Q3Q8_9BACL